MSMFDIGQAARRSPASRNRVQNTADGRKQIHFRCGRRSSADVSWDRCRHRRNPGCTGGPQRRGGGIGCQRTRAHPLRTHRLGRTGARGLVARGTRGHRRRAGSRQATGAEIEAIGLTGQMHGCVMLDADGEVLRPALIWCDQRTQPECDWLEAKIGRERLIELTCNPALPNFTLTKLLWVRTHQPEIFGRIAHVLCPKDYVRFRLTGEYAIDMQEASGTLLLDVAHRRWSQEVAEAAGIPMSWLPRLFEGPEICARISAAGASRNRPGRRNSRSRGRGRSGRRRRRHGHRGNRLRLGHHRHQRRRLRLHRQAHHGPPGPPPHLLPRRPRPLARHGRNQRRRPLAALVPRHLRPRRQLRRAHRGRREDSRRQRRPAVGAVSLRRAHAAPRPAKPAPPSSASPPRTPAPIASAQ